MIASDLGSPIDKGGVDAVLVAERSEDPAAGTEPGSPRDRAARAAGLAMAFKLIEAAQDRWRAVNAPHLVALVRAGATFINGQHVERPAETAAA